MSLGCWFVQRSLAVRAVDGGPTLPGLVVRHAAACSRCRRAAADYNAIDAALQGSPPSPPMSDGFTSAALRRWSERNAARIAVPLMPAASAAMALAVFAVWLGLVNAHRWPSADSRRAVYRRSVTQTAESALTIARQDPVQFSPSVSPQLHSRLHRHRHRIRPVARHIRPVAAAARGATPIAVGKRETAYIRSVRWSGWGAWYEWHGDYPAAAASYGRALDVAPNPGLALDAGRAAESAGDIARAVDYYARALSLTHVSDHPSEKGPLKWDSAFPSA